MRGESKMSRVELPWGVSREGRSMAGATEGAVRETSTTRGALRWELPLPSLLGEGLRDLGSDASARAACAGSPPGLLRGGLRDLGSLPPGFGESCGGVPAPGGAPGPAPGGDSRGSAADGPAHARAGRGGQRACGHVQEVGCCCRRELTA